MKIVVIGSGKVGFVLTKQLSQEGHNIVLVDKDIDVLHDAQDILDVATVCGNGATVETQREAGVSTSDLTISCTTNDEVNLLCSLVAHKLGCKHVIARIRNPEYDNQLNLLRDDIGLSHTINPDKNAAVEIFRLIQYPSFSNRETFAGGLAEIVEFRLPVHSPVVNKKLSEINYNLTLDSLMCAVRRENETVIPKGSFELKAGDIVTVMAPSLKLPVLLSNIGIETPKIKNVLLIGGSTIATYLAKLLKEVGVHVTIADTDGDRCVELADQMPNVTIMNAKSYAKSSLMGLRIDTYDSVITLTGRDEENIVISQMAKQLGIKQIITKANRMDSENEFDAYGLDTVVIPKLLIANDIIRYVRAIGESREGGIETLYRIAAGQVEALGFTVPNGDMHVGIKLSQLRVHSDVLLACIVRNRKIIIPKGQDTLEPGDSLWAIASPKLAIANFSELFQDGGSI